MKKLILIFLLAGSHHFVFSQQTDKQNSSPEAPHFDQLKVFSPLFYPDKGNEYRSASGMPGPKYWQNRADYQLDVTLDTANHRISGTTVITYTNNSPDKMNFLWLYLEQNALRADSRSAATNAMDGRRLNNESVTHGNLIKSVSIIKNGKSELAEYLITDTRLQIFLKDILGIGGQKIRIKIEYAFDIPVNGIQRMGRSITKNGWIWTIAQWYPRMAVYDDISGWNVMPYLGSGEFYLEYGDFDFTIHTPADLIVVGSGELVNPVEVLTTRTISRLAVAKNSDLTVMIRDSIDVLQNQHPAKTMLSWHFICKNARDVAWAASKAFIWDAARIKLPSGKKALAQSVYPKESVGKNRWSRSTEYIKAAVEFYSASWYEYSYPVATSVAQHYEGGMEYPGVIFDEMNDMAEDVWETTSHEFGHNWFPMIVGSNERKYGWMDEGFNTFINTLASKQFNKGEFLEPRDLRLIKDLTPDLQPIMTLPDVSSSSITNYEKPSLGLTILREQILGEKRFDFAFRTYIHRWAFKHPTPWDFFHCMDNAAGEDLSWFWNEWFLTNWKLNQSVIEIKYSDSDYSKGAFITLENLGEMALPVTLAIKETNGKTDTVRLPAEIWMQGATYTFPYPSTSKIQYIIIDPLHKLPNINPENNYFSDLSIPPGTDANKVIKNYLDAIGGEDKIIQMKDLVIESEAKMNGETVIFNLQNKRPDKLKIKRFMPASNQKLSEFSMVGDSLFNNDAQNRKLARAATIWYDPFPELAFKSQGYRLELAARVQLVNDKPAYGITATSLDGIQLQCFYDFYTGLKLKETRFYPYIRSNEFSDYREINNGIKIPFSWEGDTIWYFYLKYKVKSVKVDTGMSDDVFK
jgi:Peptidase family M1 domain